MATTACIAPLTLVGERPAGATGEAVAPEFGTAIATSDAAKDMTNTANGLFPVNGASGDFWHTFTDVSVGGTGPGLDLTRTYNSLEASKDKMFGYGWTSSYSSYLTFNGDSSITVTEDDGSQVTAASNGSGGYVVPGWADSSLVKNGDGTYTFVRQRGTRFSYSAGGKLTAVTDANGYSTSLTYNGSNQLTAVTDASGRTIALTYGSNGLVSSATDPMSRETTYAYDSSDDLTSVTDPLGHVTSFTYSSGHLMATMILPNDQSGGPDAGDKVSNTYNGSGQVISQSDPMGRETTYAYSGDNFSAVGGTTTITDPDGYVEVEDYVNGTLTSLTKGYATSSAATWSYQYDPTSLGVTRTTDPNGHVTSSTYDANGNLLTNTNALGNTWTYSYNAFNEQTCAAEPLAASPCSSLSPPADITAGTATITAPSSAPPAYVTFSEYDTKGNPIYETTGDYLPGSGSATQSRTTYDLYNGESVTLGANEDSCATSAPASELACATINADGVVTQLAYDGYGDLSAKSTADRNVVSSPGTMSTLAGGPMGPVNASQLAQVAVQVATVTIGSTSYAYLADPQNNVIRRVNLANDTETVIAGIYAWGYFGDDMPATMAQTTNPQGVAVDSAGDVALADTYDNKVRFIPASGGTYFGQSMTGGDIYTIAGDGTAGYAGDGGPATSSELDGPINVAFDADSIVIADTANNVVRYVAASSGTFFGQAMTEGDIYTIAGTGTAGYGGDGGPATSAHFDSPIGVAVDSAGDVAVADRWNNVIHFIAAASGTYYGQAMTEGDVYVIAGVVTYGDTGDGGPATSAQINSPNAVAFDATGDLAIADTNNNVVRFVAATTGTHFGQAMTADDIYTIAGTGTSGSTGDGGSATSAELGNVAGVALDAAGDLVVSDPDNGEVRIVAASSGTLAGQPVSANDIYDLAETGVSQINDTGPAASAELNYPSNVRTDGVGDLFIADTGNNAIRFIPKTSGTYFGQTMTANHIYAVAGNGTAGYAGDGGPATSGELNGPTGVAIDTGGDLFVADSDNSVVRFVPASTGTYFGQSMTADDIYTIAGNATAGYAGDGGPATTGELNGPNGVAVDPAGDLLIADSDNSVLRFVPASTGTYFGQSMTADDIYTIAGNATAGYAGDGGSATTGELNGPNGATFDSAGDVLIADSANNVLRFVPATTGTHYGQSMTADDIYTIAGNATAGYAGDGGRATAAQVADVLDATYDAAGNIYVCDSGNDVIRFIPAVSGTYYGRVMTANDIYTLAGAGWTAYHFAGDGAAPLDAEFGWLESVTPDGSGGYYIVDYVDQRVRHVTVDDIESFAATTSYTYNADGEVTSVTSPDGNLAGANAADFTTTYNYNAGGQATAITQAGGVGASVTPRTTSYAYDANGNETSVTVARGYTTTYTYDADDELTLSTNALANATLTCYDGDGNVAETVPAVGVAASSLTPASCPTSYPSGYGDRLASDATTSGYSALGEQTVVTTPAPPGLSGFETTTYAYDLGGRLTSVTAPPTSTSGGAASDETDYTYDAAGERLTTTSGAGTPSASTASSCYDPNGDVTASVAPDGNTGGVAACATSSPYETASAYQTGYSRDSLGELVTQTAPATSAAPSGQVTAYSYDPAGNQVVETNPDGVSTTRTYTPLNRLASVSYSDATPGVMYAWDANGNRTAMIDASGTSSFAYDPFNELTSATNAANAVVAYAYDLDGNVTAVTYPLGDADWASTDTVAYAYDEADRLSSVTDFTGNTSNVTVTSDGLPAALSLGASGDTLATTYAANDAPASITLGNGSTVLQAAYSDAPSGGVVSESDTPSSPLSPASYTYNAQSQVTSDTAGSSGTKSYTQDASGNVTTLANAASGSYDNASELTSTTLSGTTTSFTYDASGNRTAESVGATTTASATYNGAGDLASYADAAASMSSATYDGLGLRTSATTTPSGAGVSTQNFVWDTITSVPALLMDSTNAYICGPSGTPFEQVNLTSGTIQYLVADALGSVRGIVSSSGALSASTSYDAWGNPETSGGLTSSTPFGFDGGYTDPTGLVYLINRYYDPATDQFLSIDPDVADTNQPYAFVNDDPLNLTDALGLIPTLGVNETNQQVAEVAVIDTQQKGDALEATTKALATYINTSNAQEFQDINELRAACSPGTDESNCGAMVKRVRSLSRKINNAVEEIGPYALDAVLLLKASLQVASSLPKWADSVAVLKNSIGTDLQEEAAVSALTDAGNLSGDLMDLANGFDNLLNDVGDA